MIEINRISDPLKLEGRVGSESFTFFRSKDHWVFYVSDGSPTMCEYIFALTARYPVHLAMPQDIAVKIALACAKHYQKQFID